MWITWVIVSLAFIAWLTNILLLKEDKQELLIGETTHGHFQIEMACESCHSRAFGGAEVLQEACVDCHAKELETAHDSHPRKKFTNPREAFRIEILDGRYCISCHTEHKKEQTGEMGLTLPEDYCYHCHQEVGDDRESHKDLPFDSCGSAGCHNYHDNRALYEKFLVDNSGQPWLGEIARVASTTETDHLKKPAITAAQSQYQNHITQHPDVAAHWQASSHAQAGVDCGGCHTNSTKSDLSWIEKPTLDQCEHCHKKETAGFTSGKHGMRLAPQHKIELKPITPAESKLAFKQESFSQQHSCNACHSAHEFNPKQASFESCVSCHADEHTQAYENSPHGMLWQKELKGELPDGSGVSCASCHMPRTEDADGNIFVQHNQNDNLRPNEKMIRSVCMNCHSLEFSIDALADDELIKNNFSGKPGIHIESIDWATKRSK